MEAEHEDERRGDRQGRPEHTLRAQVHVVDDAVEVIAAVLEQSRGIAAEATVEKEKDHNDGQQLPLRHRRAKMDEKI